MLLPGFLQVALFLLPALLVPLRALLGDLRKTDVELPGEVESRLNRAADSLHRAPDGDYVAVEEAPEAVGVIIVEVQGGGLLVMGDTQRLALAVYFEKAIKRDFFPQDLKDRCPGG